MRQSDTSRAIHAHQRQPPQRLSKISPKRGSLLKVHNPSSKRSFSLGARFLAIFGVCIVVLLATAIYLFSDIIIHSSEEQSSASNPSSAQNDGSQASNVMKKEELDLSTRINNVLATTTDDSTDYSDNSNEPLPDRSESILAQAETSDDSEGSSDASDASDASDPSELANIANLEYPLQTGEIDVDSDDFYYLLHRRWYGFTASDFDEMESIIHDYAEYHARVVKHDTARATRNERLEGRYIVLSPGAQMCNRLRAFMGTVYLGILTRRVVFIDIGKEGYAARLDGVFKNPGFDWEYAKIAGPLKNALKGAKRVSFPYEGNGQQQTKMTCHDWGREAATRVWQLDSLAAFLPVMGRNDALATGVMMKKNDGMEGSKLKFEEEYDFDTQMVSKFSGKSVQSVNDKFQENFEKLEVLMGRILYKLEDALQKRVDEFVAKTYEKARQFYKAQGVEWDESQLGPPPVVGMHIRSEYVLSMNLPKGKGGIGKMQSEYEWFEDCGKLIVNSNILPKGGKDWKDMKYFIFLAADTKDAQKFGLKVFGDDRVMLQPFVKTGATLDGIKDAVVDLVTVASFDGFVSTPHSSYSEMASLLGQPRRVINTQNGGFEYLQKVANKQWHRLPVNRPIVPMMTHTEWEIKKFNNYMYGRAVDISLSGPSTRYVPLTKELNADIDFKKDDICKQQIVAGMGWMGMYHMFKSTNCYDKNLHHPSIEWFPVANK